MSENQTTKSNTLVVMASENSQSIYDALSNIVSKSHMQKPTASENAMSFIYLGKDDFSRSSVLANHPKEIFINSSKYYEYPILFQSFNVKKKTYFLIYSRFAAALKEFVIKKLELELQALKETIIFLEIDLLQVKAALENGESLKGQLAATSSRIDCFGDSGLEKVVLRGGDVFSSTKYDSIWNVLTGNLPKSAALHSLVLLFEKNRMSVKVTLDKFGNFRLPLTEEGKEVTLLAELVKFLTKFSKEKGVCPLRRITTKEAAIDATKEEDGE